MSKLGQPPWTYEDGATHLGDGVYARRDASQQIILRTETMKWGFSEIALEPEIFAKLLEWSGVSERIRKQIAVAGLTAAQVQQMIQEMCREQGS